MTAAALAAHHLLLKDKVRVESYRRAIMEVVRPGDTVIDLGAGTGVLSLFAIAAGAKKVFAVETEPMMAKYIHHLAKDNNAHEKIEVVNADSWRVEDLPKCDVLLCDAMGFFGISEEMAAFFDLRDRFLGDGGRTIPATVDLFLAPVSLPEVREWLRTSIDGLNVDVLNRTFSSDVLSVFVRREHLAAKPSRVAALNLSHATSTRLQLKSQWDLAGGANIDGIAGWYQAALSPGVSLATGPETRRPMGRARFFPLGKTAVQEGPAHLKLTMDVMPEIAIWTGKVTGTESIHFARCSLSAHPDWHALGLQEGAIPKDVCTYIMTRGEAFGDAIAPELRQGLDRIIADTMKYLAGGGFIGTAG